MANKIFMAMFKWLLIPLALAFIGYAFIGPYIGRNPPSALKELAKKAEPQVQADNAPPAPDETEGSGKDWPEPKVEVELRRLNGNRVRDREVHKTDAKANKPEDVTDENIPAGEGDENVQPKDEGDTAPASPEEPPREDLPDGPGA